MFCTKIMLLIPALAVFLLLFGCTIPDINTNTNNGGTNLNGNAAICPDSLQSCGTGCIPTNAICCDYDLKNAYCLQPTTGCGNGSCYECPAEQAFCGMFCAPAGEKCCAGNDCGTATQTTTTNHYVGTYEFKGVYTYHTNEDCKEADSDLVTNTLTVRATFEAPSRELYNGVPLENSWDPYTVWVTKLWADDSDFSRGADGVAPKDYGFSKTELLLPWLPRDATDPDNYGVCDECPDGRIFAPVSKHAFVFEFPDDLIDEYGTTVSFSGHFQEGYYISNDGKTMHSYPPVITDMFDSGGTWSARNKLGSGPLSDSATIGPNRTVFCGPRFVSWTATKVSD